MHCSTASSRPNIINLLPALASTTPPPHSLARIRREWDPALELDIQITEEREEGPQYGIYGGTYELTEERKYDRSVEANATVSTTIEPVPLPVDLTPAERYERPDEEPDS